MADVKVPIKFEIYKGDNLVREELLTQSPIRIGKLGSSDLRLDDETVSRMHGVIEAPAATSMSPTWVRRAARRSTANGSQRLGCSRVTRSCSATAA